MNARIFFLIALLGALGAACTQKGSAPEGETLNKVVYDKGAQQKILYGPCNRKGFGKEAFAPWFEEGYADYQPDTAILAKFDRAKYARTQIDIVLATWCPDSRRELPRFFRIIDLAGLSADQVSMLGVNRAFEAPGFQKGTRGVTYVPTFIFTRNGKELGRIVEHPEKSLEADMVAILNRTAPPAK